MTNYGFTPAGLPPQSPVQPQAGPANAAELAKRAQIKDTAERFEATFLSSMLQQMFDGVEPAAPFGGGPGESMFKSFLTDAMGKQMSKGGGIGIAAQVQREMLKMQGLT
ncbi:rod-binding protein [Phenylobacterium sp. LjRoot219]|uniref:rod-binding protein n=1 Tax=Phenylobacterium sp. LjRoot219 TaxID=3342283 RepID=UPI003F4F92AF